MNKGKIALLQITPFLYTDNGTLNKENEQRLRDIDECLDEYEKKLNIACELLAEGYGNDWASGRYEVNGKTIKFIPKEDTQMWKDLLEEIAKEKDNER